MKPNGGSPHPTRTRLFPIAAVMLLAWGALAFGAEYSWAYAPLLVLSVVVGVLGLVASRASVDTDAGAGGSGEPQDPPLRRSVRPGPEVAITTALAVVFLAGALQLIPLPRDAVAVVSPASGAADYRQLYAEATMRASSPPLSPREGENARARERDNGTRTLSIEPSRTALSLTFLATFTLLFVGTTRAVGTLGPQEIARGVVALGAVVALVGIVQRAAGTETVYGFWYPPKGGVFSAPFINENHTAGWLVMAMSLATGWFASGVAHGLRGVKPDWRNRILWFSSPQASETILTGFAIALMALSVVVTVSRGGLVCLLAAIALSAWWVVRGQPSRLRRGIVATYLALVLATAAWWGRAETILREFEGATLDIGGRLSIWQDAVGMIQEFPLTGTGLNTFGIAMLNYQTIDDGNLYIEAHNDYLQLAAEGGLMLGVPILVALGVFVREIWRRFGEGADDARAYCLRAGAVTGLGAIAVQEVFDFTLQMPGAAVLFVILAAIATHRPKLQVR